MRSPAIPKKGPYPPYPETILLDCERENGGARVAYCCVTHGIKL